MTTVATALKQVTLLGFDTSPLIYFVERHPAYVAVMRALLQRIDTGEVRGCTSVITVVEVLVQPKKHGNVILENEYRHILQTSKNFELLMINEQIAEQAADLRARYVIRTPDALQIAAALSIGCQAFVTNDKRLRSVTELKILVLDELLP